MAICHTCSVHAHCPGEKCTAAWLRRVHALSRCVTCAATLSRPSSPRTSSAISGASTPASTAICLSPCQGPGSGPGQNTAKSPDSAAPISEPERDRPPDHDYTGAYLCAADADRIVAVLCLYFCFHMDRIGAILLIFLLSSCVPLLPSSYSV